MIKFFSILMFLFFLNTVAIHANDDSTRMSFKVTVKPHVKQKHRLKPIMSRTSHQIEDGSVYLYLAVKKILLNF